MLNSLSSCMLISATILGFHVHRFSQDRKTPVRKLLSTFHCQVMSKIHINGPTTVVKSHIWLKFCAATFSHAINSLLILFLITKLYPFIKKKMLNLILSAHVYIFSYEFAYLGNNN